VPETAAPAPAAVATARAGGDAWPASDVAQLRSVRSEALRGEDAGRAPFGETDDLKRIRGIGVLIEKKLNSLGVTHYEQVANWTGADIERISRILDFKGRIERENWIEQARILATGGQTEFSRRSER
jgi:predicted flap endonuclease-1-like 5' DNA nuclease